MNSPIEEIKKAVAENRTSDALSRLLELSKSDKQLHDAILIFSGEFKDLTLQQLKGVIDNKEATQRLNGVHDKILRALEAFDSEGQPVRGSDVVGKKTSAAGMLGRIALFFVSGIILPCIIVLLTHGIQPFEGNPQGRTLFSDIFLGISIISSVLGAITFLAYLLAMVVSASKK